MNWSRGLVCALALLFALSFAAGEGGGKGEKYADGTDAEIVFPTVTLRVGSATLRAEVASSPKQRARGSPGGSGWMRMRGCFLSLSGCPFRAFGCETL